MKPLLLVVLLFAAPSFAVAHNHLTETRYCGEPARNADGSIKRNHAVVAAFKKLYPLPPDKDPNDWQVDHVLPLADGGCDAVRNMQWLPKVIKTCAGSDCKDRWERRGIYDRSSHE